MRRIILALAVIGTLSGVANAQMLKAIVADSATTGGADFTTNCSESNTFLNTRVGGVASGIGSTIAGYYDTLICGLVTDGYWAKLDALYVLAAPTTSIAEMNLISSSYTLTPHGTGTFTANSDWQGNGSTGYLDTGFVPSTAGGHYTATSAVAGTYTLNNIGGGEASSSLGAWDGSSNRRVAITPMYTNATAYIVVNDTSNPANVGATVSSGCRVGGNNGTFAQISRVSTDGSAGDLAFSTSPLMPDRSVYLGAVNNAGTAADISTYKIAVAFLGENIDNVSDTFFLCQRINTFLTSQGVNAY